MIKDTVLEYKRLNAVDTSLIFRELRFRIPLKTMDNEMLSFFIEKYAKDM